MTQASAKAQPQPAAEPKIDEKTRAICMAETTYFWHPEEEGENEIARLWVQDKFPDSQALIVSEMVIQRLTELNHVVVMSRDRKPKKNQLHPIIVNAETGVRSVGHNDPSELIHSVRVSPPIAVAPYIEGSSKYRVGKFDHHKFFDELGKWIGGAMRVQGPEGTIRYLLG